MTPTKKDSNGELASDEKRLLAKYRAVAELTDLRDRLLAQYERACLEIVMERRKLAEAALFSNKEPRETLHRWLVSEDWTKDSTGGPDAS